MDLALEKRPPWCPPLHPEWGAGQVHNALLVDSVISDDGKSCNENQSHVGEGSLGHLGMRKTLRAAITRSEAGRIGGTSHALTCRRKSRGRMQGQVEELTIWVRLGRLEMAPKH